MQRKLLWSLLFFLLLPVLFLFPVPTRASTNIIVNSKLDVITDDGYCTLREAIIAANTNTSSGGAYGECPAGSGTDTILLPAGIYTLTIGGVGEDNSLTGDLDIKQDVNIQGNGSGCLSNPTCTSINGFYNDRVFDIALGVRVRIIKLDIVNGRTGTEHGAGISNLGVLLLQDVYLSNNATINVAHGGGLYNAAGGSATLDRVGFLLNHSYVNGGGIYNVGILTTTNSLFTLDSADNSGGGLSNDGTATFTDTTFAYESSTGCCGGGIMNSGNLTLNRVTLDHNQTSGFVGGGAILNGSSSAITLTNVTLSTNSSNAVGSAGGALMNEGSAIAALTNVSVVSNTAPSGGGIFNNGGTVSLKNTIVAYSASGGNCAGATISSSGYNLSSDTSCSSFSATGDLTNINPLLGPLANNGGTTFTHALLPGSPAINSGTNFGCPSTDQRGYPRVGTCDRGAYEYLLRLFLPLIQK